MGLRAKKAKRWPNGKILYTFGKGTDVVAKGDKAGLSLKDVLLGCMRRWEELVNTKANKVLIEFKEDATAQYHVVFEEIGGDPYATAGSVALTKAKANEPIKFQFSNNDETLVTFPHEFAHLIGLAHEHIRSVMMKKGDLKNGKSYLRFTGKTSDLEYFAYQMDAGKYDPDGEYDPDSITHYPASNNLKLAWVGKALAIRMPRIEAVKKKAQDWNPSPGDIAAVINLYS